MSANVLYNKFGTTIRTSQVSSDGYEITNLLSNDPSLRRKGFLGERFIKPPVDIYVRFEDPLELNRIVLNGRVGSQKSNGFEIYSQINQANTSVFYPLAKTVVNADQEEAVFVNTNFVPRSPFSPESSQKLHNNVVKLRHHLSQTLTNVSQIQIRITRTLNSCIPALGKLEIWAQPSSFCSKDVTMKFYNTYKNLCALPPSTINYLVPKDEPQQESLPLSSNEIPPEFVDPISCDIMVLPVLLPSGHSIDQGTLDKYLASEASWGRSPNDPFTGLPFNSSKKPLPHSALKARIDHYLLTHENIAKTLPRCTGRKSEPKIQFPSKRPPYLVPETGKRVKLQGNTFKTLTTHELNLKESLDSSVKQILNSYPTFTKTGTTEDDDEDNKFCCPHNKWHEIYKLPCEHLICRLCLVKKRENSNFVCDECKISFNSNEPIRTFL